MAGAGTPAGAAPPPPPPPPAPGYGYPPPPPPAHGYGTAGGDPNATQQAELCPRCRSPREPGAPFCGECRWNFAPGQTDPYSPMSTAPPTSGPTGGPGGPGPFGSSAGMDLPPGFLSGPPSQGQGHQDPHAYQGTPPPQGHRPAGPPTPEPPQGPTGRNPGPPGPPPPPPPQGFPPPGQAPQSTGGDDWLLPPPSHRDGPQHQGGPQPGPRAPHGMPPQAYAPAPPAPGPGTAAHDRGPAFPPAPAPAFPPPGHQPGPGGATGPGGHGPGAAPAGWSVVVAPDGDYFTAMMRRSGPEAAGLTLPGYAPERHVPLTGKQVSIGRRRQSTGESPDIDLSGPPEDPGVSHQHAILVQQPDGSWAVVDQNSTNGTTVNGGEDPIQPYVPVPLREGDRVHVGAWTTLTVVRG